MAEPTARITIARRAAEDVKQRQVFVSMDGRPLAALLYGETFTGEVPAGVHRFRAHNTLVWKTLDLELNAGEHARFRIVNRPGFGTYAFLSLLGTGPIYLTFEREAS
jgi:hypothetical protein